MQGTWSMEQERIFSWCCCIYVLHSNTLCPVSDDDYRSRQNPTKFMPSMTKCLFDMSHETFFSLFVFPFDSFYFCFFSSPSTTDASVYSFWHTALARLTICAQVIIHSFMSRTVNRSQPLTFHSISTVPHAQTLQRWRLQYFSIISLKIHCHRSKFQRMRKKKQFLVWHDSTCDCVAHFRLLPLLFMRSISIRAVIHWRIRRPLLFINQ